MPDLQNQFLEQLDNQIIFYGAFLLFAVVFGVVLNKIFLKISRNFGVDQVSGQARWSSNMKPTLGGFSFYIIFLFAFSIFSIFFEADIIHNKMLGLLLSVTSGFLLGLADDAYGTNPFLKFLAQFLCGNIVVATGLVISITTIDTVNYVFTVFWVIGIMNSINMLDNMDGIATITAIFIILSALVLMIIEGMITQVYFFVLIGVMGTLLGFLFFNAYPAKIYMGDTGAQFLGMFLAAIAILFFWQYRDFQAEIIQLKQFLLPMLIFIVPLIDTTTVFIRRIMRGQSPFLGGKDHITHHLAYVGLSERSVMLVLGGLSFISLLLMIFILKKMDSWNYAYTFMLIGYFILVFLIIQVFYVKGEKIYQANLAKKQKKT